MAEKLVIRCRENGPLVVEGEVILNDHLGNAFIIPEGKKAIALCRCGNSGNKPFCDGSHKTAQFVAGEVAEPPQS